ncbi:MAG: tetratricopeptide repeat protein [Muribaculaceae bacterium]|nr:tetratricopeptide repeat protein [Muribaculaceae bacterium]
MSILRKTIFTSIAVIAAQGFTAVAQHSHGLDNPVTKAVMEVYEKQLRANPDDFAIWFRRANEYYNHNAYGSALEDINQALRCTPPSDKDLRFQEYMLRAAIYNQMDRHESALADLNSAIVLEPTSFHARYQRANTAFQLGQYQMAKADYQALQRERPRSSEILLGLGRVAAVENNIGIANDYMNQAVSMDPSNSQLYIARARIKQSMNDIEAAASDYITAISLNTRSSKPVNGLMDCANLNYSATLEALNNAVSSMPEVPLYRYLRAQVEQNNMHYRDALDDYSSILSQFPVNRFGGIYAAMAECQYKLMQFSDAYKSISSASDIEKLSQDELMLKSEIMLALGQTDEATKAAAKAAAMNTKDARPLEVMARCYAHNHNYTTAIGLLKEASELDPENSTYPLLAGWLALKAQKNDMASELLSPVCTLIANDGKDDMNRIMAQILSGATANYSAALEMVLSLYADNDGTLHFMAACCMAQAKDKISALTYLNQALEAGYGDKEAVMGDNIYTPYNLSALYSDSMFEAATSMYFNK